MNENRISTYSRGSLTFDVVDSGPADGEVIVLLHGFPQTSTCWARVWPLLGKLGYRTLAPDLRGYSPGARPRGRRAYRSKELVADVAELIDLAGAPVHVVGHDWGAAISWGVCLDQPDLVRSHTSVSVPHPAAFIRSMLASPQLFRSWYMLFFQLPFLPEAALEKLPAIRDRALAATGMDPELRHRVVAEVIDSGALPGGLGYYRALPFSLDSIGGEGQKPTTHVWSTGDSALDRKGALLCEQYVDAPYELEILQGHSHWIPDQAPEELVQIIANRAGITS